MSDPKSLPERLRAMAEWMRGSQAGAWPEQLALLAEAAAEIERLDDANAVEECLHGLRMTIDDLRLIPMTDYGTGFNAGIGAACEAVDAAIRALRVKEDPK